MNALVAARNGSAMNRRASAGERNATPTTVGMSSPALSAMFNETWRAAPTRSPASRGRTARGKADVREFDTRFAGVRVAVGGGDQAPGTAPLDPRARVGERASAIELKVDRIAPQPRTIDFASRTSRPRGLSSPPFRRRGDIAQAATGNLTISLRVD